jgi:hypothetical protein
MPQKKHSKQVRIKNAKRAREARAQKPKGELSQPFTPALKAHLFRK